MVQGGLVKKTGVYVQGRLVEFEYRMLPELFSLPRRLFLPMPWCNSFHIDHLAIGWLLAMAV